MRSAVDDKFPWRMMLISMEDVRVLLEFFKNHVVPMKRGGRGAKVLLERIEDYEGLAVDDLDDSTNGSAANTLSYSNHQSLQPQDNN